MLSEQEYQTTKWQLEHLLKHTPSKLILEQCSNLRKTLRKKLNEHDYATRFHLFEPLPHFIYFINRATTTSNKFILDTESVIIPYQPNKPVLIQIQILLPYRSSIILIFEMCHLPHEHENKFSLLNNYLILY
jgi:hypothetical protein